MRTFTAARGFDAILGRLILFHLPDAVEVVRHHAGALLPGGRFIAIDFDIATARAEPPVPLVTATLEWIISAFRAAGANPVIGARLAPILNAAGLAEVTTYGIQRYLAAGEGTRARPARRRRADAGAQDPGRGHRDGR